MILKQETYNEVVVEFAGFLANADSVVFVFNVSLLDEVVLQIQVVVCLLQVFVLDLITMSPVLRHAVLQL